MTPLVYKIWNLRKISNLKISSEISHVIYSIQKLYHNVHRKICLPTWAWELG